MQEYVKISTDKQTTELLRQVSDAIELAIFESGNNIEIKESLDTVVKNQNEFPNFIDLLNEELIKINTKLEKVSENKVSQIISKNEINRNIIIEQIVALSEKLNKQNNTLSDVRLLQQEIGENSKPISENLHKAIEIGNNSSQTLDKISKELSDIKEQVKSDGEQITNSIKSIIDKQQFLLESIKTVVSIQREPWYKKIFK